MTDPKTDQNSTPPPAGILSGIRNLASQHVSVERLPDRKGQLIFWMLLAGGLALDLWSKEAIFAWLYFDDSFTVIDGLLRLVPAVNNGAAFGICAGRPFFLTAASIIAMLIVLAFFYLSGTGLRLVQAALGLLAAGICGNLYDRVFNDGLVRDFIDVYINAFERERHWNTFNVADALLCIGVGLLIIWTGFTGKSAQKRAQQHK
jgi:signal peptidase II